MIVRADGNTLLLVTQPDHAALSAEIMAGWRAEGFHLRATRDAVLHATREHDNGWREIDAAPPVASDGRPYDFMTLPDEMKQSIWPRAVRRLGRERPAAGALVAEHALTVLRRHRSGRKWKPFFEELGRMRDALIARSGALWKGADDRFLSDYRIVHLGDLLSLVFCNGWTEPYRTLGYEIRLERDHLRIAPDPFEGARVPLGVRARRVAARPYVDDADLAGVLAEAPWVELEGMAQGS